VQRDSGVRDRACRSGASSAVDEQPGRPEGALTSWRVFSAADRRQAAGSKVWAWFKHLGTARTGRHQAYPPRGEAIADVSRFLRNALRDGPWNRREPARLTPHAVHVKGWVVDVNSIIREACVMTRAAGTFQPELPSFPKCSRAFGAMAAELAALALSTGTPRPALCFQQ
jgi:hypothetical protein